MIRYYCDRCGKPLRNLKDKEKWNIEKADGEMYSKNVIELLQLHHQAT